MFPPFVPGPVPGPRINQVRVYRIKRQSRHITGSPANVPEEWRIVLLSHDSWAPGYQHGLANRPEFIHRGMRINCESAVGLCYGGMRFPPFAMGHLGWSEWIRIPFLNSCYATIRSRTDLWVCALNGRCVRVVAVLWRGCDTCGGASGSSLPCPLWLN